ncbi:MAG: helix-turn-helix domain-containing protein [Pseudonocardiales bacterium]|nr:helix-turn-helix domain-containing protein [Pseudonocardiales bacterium]
MPTSVPLTRNPHADSYSQVTRLTTWLKQQAVRTLSAYLRLRESLKHAARRLQAHSNTASYRIQRIEQLSQLDLTDPQDRILTHLPTKIIEAQRINAPITASIKRSPLSVS